MAIVKNLRLGGRGGLKGNGWGNEFYFYKFCLQTWQFGLTQLSSRVKFFFYKVIFKVCNICFRFQKYAILVTTANSLRTVCMIWYVDMLSLWDLWLLFLYDCRAKRNVKEGHRFNSEIGNTDSEIKRH